MAEQLLIIPALALGVILGVYELILVHGDENFRASHWFGHGLHAIGFMIVALFIVLNTTYFMEIAGVAGWSWLPEFLKNEWVIRVIVVLILNIKMHAVTAARKGSIAGLPNPKEHWTHTTLIALLVLASPLYWPLLAPFIPNWAGGTGQ